MKHIKTTWTINRWVGDAKRRAAAEIERFEEEWKEVYGFSSETESPDDWDYRFRAWQEALESLVQKADDEEGNGDPS